ncbi:DUF3887 domain-containing protein [Streptomyces sp. NPDC058157]|uniref:DUF3887 domain-containing protein n=1 Tax=Streptomyces sp. NPDC058157 TaxID=3346360 RepID=UPI0036EC43BC
MAVTPRRSASVRSAVVAVAAAAALCVVADGSAAAVAGRPAEVTAPARDSYARPALDTLDEVVRGDFDAVRARFGTELRQQVSPEALRQSWDAYRAEFGDYVSHGEPRQTGVAAGTVVSVPLRMAKQPGEFRVTFGADGRLTGLWFLRAGVPLP